MAVQLFPHNLKLSLAKCEHTHTGQYIVVCLEDLLKFCF